jgi:molecular chaperone DnaJ
MVNIVTCQQCGGTGKIIKNKCKECHGSGTVRKTKTIEVNIPAGADTGVRMRVSGEGEPGKRGGAYGDLYVYIIVEGDPDFERDGDDLYKAINISFTTAALGSTIQVETLVKKVELKIPAGTQSGTRFRISGEGMPHLQSSRKGSLYVEVKVTVPKKLNEDQKEALLNYAHVCGEDVKQFKGKGSWLDKIIDKIMN